MKYRLLAILMLLVCAVPVLAGRPRREAVVLVTMEGISLDQLTKSDAGFRHLIDSGSVGLMNNKTDSGLTFENNAVTIGAGTRGIGNEFSHYGFNASEVEEGEIAGLVYQRNTGMTAPETSVVQTKLATIQSLNIYQHYDIFPGKMGSMLQDQHVYTSVYGNSDQGILFSRNGVLIAMNTDGRTMGGDVSARTLVRDPGRPFGVRTDYDYILRAIGMQSADRTFTVVEAGDGRRLESAKKDLLPKRCVFMRNTLLSESGRFLSTLNEYLKANTDRYLLIFAVTTQGSEAFEIGDRLTPVIFLGTNIPHGMIMSSTTKCPGVLTNIDLAPTVLSFFGVKQDASMLGSPLTASPHRDALAALQADNKRMVRTFQARVPVLYGYVVCVGICVFLTIFSVLLHGKAASYFGWILSPSFLRHALMSLMLAPATLWIEPALHIVGTLPSALFLVAATVSGSMALNRWVKDLRLILTIIGLTNMAVVTGDLLLGNMLLRRTILSYDPIAGIRFYGLGNECSGVLMGSTLLGVFSLLDYTKRLRSWLLPAIFFAAIALIIGSPNHGSDFGGTVTYFCAFGYALLKARDIRFNLKTLAVMGSLGAVMVFGVIAANTFMQPDQQTHIGRFFSQLASGDFKLLFDTAIRKWGMNLRLMRYSVWTHFLYLLMIGLVVLFRRPVGVVQSVLSKHPAMNAGFKGILIGAIVAMLTNDSGIAMAATSLLFLAAPLFLMVKQELAQG